MWIKCRWPNRKRANEASQKKKGAARFVDRLVPVSEPARPCTRAASATGAEKGSQKKKGTLTNYLSGWGWGWGLGVLYWLFALELAGRCVELSSN